MQWHALNEEKLNIQKEQQLLQSADRLILQFPLYWYSAPAILKNWLDQVITRRFAYPDADGALVRKELGIVVSLGSPARNFTAGADDHYSISQLMVPFQALTEKLEMDFLPTFVVDQFAYQTDEQKAKLLVDYQRYISQQKLGHFDAETQWLLAQFQKLIDQKPLNEQQNLKLILEQLKNNQSELADLRANLKMIQDMEDS